jgi:endonuclease III
MSHSQVQRASLIGNALAIEHRSPHHNNKADPLDELVFIMLSTMTTRASYERVYARLKKAAPTWDCLCDMPLSKLKNLIKDAGLSNQKAPRLRRIVRYLRREFGQATLRPIRRWTTERAENFLCELPGVDLKTAKCVLMYSLRRDVLPVDTHVRRIAERTGLIPRGVPSEGAHRLLEGLVPPQKRYDFHVNALAHGRAVCSALRPKCSRCCISRFCKEIRTPSRRAICG